MTKKPPKISQAKVRRLQVHAEKDALRNQSKEKHHDVAQLQADSAGEGSSSLSSNTMTKKALGEPSWWVMRPIYIKYWLEIPEIPSNIPGPELSMNIALVCLYEYASNSWSSSSLSDYSLLLFFTRMMTSMSTKVDQILERLGDKEVPYEQVLFRLPLST